MARRMTAAQAQAYLDRTFGPKVFDFDSFGPDGGIIMKPRDIAEDMTEEDWHEFYLDAGEQCECGPCREARRLGY